MSKRTDKYRKLMEQHRKMFVEEQRLWKTLSKEEKDEVYDNVQPDAERFLKKVRPKPPRAAIHGDVYDGQDPPTITIDDSEGQRLWLRVGPVYNGSKMSRQDGLWVSYQPKALESEMHGPVLISPSTWRRLKKDIDKMFEGRDGRKK